MRTGSYAIYEGKEYEFHKENGQYYIASREPKDLKNGFYEEFENFYRKDVQKSELECMYTVFTVCKYMGHDFYIDLEKGDKVLISTTEDLDLDKMIRLGLSAGREEYKKWVNKSEITDVREEKNIKFSNEEKKPQIKPEYHKEEVAISLEPLSTVEISLISNGKKYKKTNVDRLPSL